MITAVGFCTRYPISRLHQDVKNVFVCMNLGRISLNLPNQLTRNLVEGCNIDLGISHNIFEQIRVKIQIHELGYYFELQHMGLVQVCAKECIHFSQL